MRRAVAALVLALVPGLAAALPNEAPVLDLAQSKIRGDWFGAGVSLDLALSEAVPYAVGVLADPPRLVVRFQSVLETSGQPRRGPEPVLVPNGLSTELQLPLDGPALLASASIDWQDDGSARLRLRLDGAGRDGFATAAARWKPAPAMTVPERPAPGYRLHVMLDPGHGGQDPGADYDGIREADVVLSLARELRRDLEADGFEVSLTREDDSFVPLSERVARTVAAGADLFVSLHADAVLIGHATGASVHSLSPESGGSGDRFLLNRLGGAALASTDGDVDDATMKVLMELAREQSLEAGEALAADLVQAMGDAGMPLYKTPRKLSNFVVLRAADVPSVLVELGYLSEPQDRARLVDPQFRADMAAALAEGITRWAETGAGQGPQ
ncbi:N-acetylmuramoyl-L-alanine amidase family protein [Mangrovicoccus algicola]|uniref:N-acetylmuramoyl-L-alanine amidase n=1 Tax=Mangrovicoccus algicola TaxID=2771008 RepID=A0A8J6Z666_9RHOB|nr:N-acetylmuramoyl-L-alanine amidase [Mangrovicoccus algicola]MBE3637046.1 N-acetylmuramoyl-L-alanine amidase [Mangrovicoccus algicola]